MISRRNLLRSLSGGLCYPLLYHGSGSGAVAKPHAPVRLGLNLSGMSYWAQEQPFSNLAHNAARWRVQIKDTPFTWDDPLPPMTPDGYPLSVPEGAWLDSFLIFTARRAHLPRELFLNYDGRGKMTYVGGGELLERRPGRDRLRNLVREDALTVRMIETDGSDPIRNIRLVEQDPPSSEEFRKAFLDRLKGMHVLRFMDWMGTNNSAVRHWQDRPQRGQFGRSDLGVPLETMVSLCNTAGLSPWFTMPHLADDDYVRAFAHQVHRDLDPALAVYVEYSNEVWNTMFDQAAHAGTRGLALGLSQDGYQAQLRYYSHRTSQMLAIWEDVFAAEAARVVGVYAAQAANPWTSETILGFGEARRFADVLAIAPYFGGGLGSPERASEVRNWGLERLFSTLEREVEADNRRQIAAQAAIARDYGLPLYAYEGGQHLVGHGGAENDDQLTELFVAANRDSRMGHLYKRHIRVWQQEGGDLYALFASMGGPSKWGSWGLLEFEGDRRPKWEAVQEMLPGR